MIISVNSSAKQCYELSLYRNDLVVICELSETVTPKLIYIAAGFTHVYLSERHQRSESGWLK